MDTNVALWCLAAPDRLSSAARTLLEDPAEDVGFSGISVVEFELKRQRLLRDDDELAAEFALKLAELGFGAVSFTADDAIGLSGVKPNRDPFDRMLAAQTISRGLTLITANRELLNYAALETTW